MPKSPLARLLIMAVVVGWITYDVATAAEAPSRALRVVQYVLLACGAIGLVGTGIQLASGQRSRDGTSA